MFKKIILLSGTLKTRTIYCCIVLKLWYISKVVTIHIYNNFKLVIFREYYEINVKPMTTDEQSEKWLAKLKINKLRVYSFSQFFGLSIIILPWSCLICYY